MNPRLLSQSIKARAAQLGFGPVGIADAGKSRHMDLYRGWIERGAHGEMEYLARPDAVARRADLQLTLEGARSVVVVADQYSQEDPPGVPDDPSRAVIARYARGDDYHEVMKRRLEELLTWIQDDVREPVAGRVYIDTGPILERELASRAGLGWFGKNTMLIDPKRGSYFFVGVLLLDLEIEPDEPFTEDRCGTCTACLDACPTGALLGRDEDGAPVIEATRCISYLTIEHRGPIPRELRALMGNRVYGCDICQEVCPWNERFAEPSDELAYRATEGLDGPTLVDLAERLLGLTEKGFLREFAGSPMTRARRKGLLRNVCVALGNWGAEEAVPTLVSALSDPARLVRGHAAWALGRVGSPVALDALSSRLADESDGFVLEEIGLAVGRRAPSA
ncbi:MAG: tRNA epoxyqueuosine(34) reductase QueG [Gemmatimonadetes bacterium]|nr:tRNA epoxyqueuosine(34) reductase QueG [Gemmatimonadota bacterium]